MVTGDKPKRVQRFGPEVWDERCGEEWSLWDLWYCVIAVGDHDGDLGGLEDVFIEGVRSPGASGREEGEAKLSHLHDLDSRLAQADINPSDLADGKAMADKAVVRRARDKVTGRIPLEWRARTPAMVDTPRHRFEHRARYGHWPTFPSDPAPFFEKFRRTVDRKEFITKGKTFAVASRLEKRLADLDGPRRRLPDRLALYRGFHTAGLELADSANDSYGVIDTVRSDAWATYLDIDWREAGMAPPAYWQDLCELRIWERYGVDHQAESEWFTSAGPDDLPVVESILLALEDELRRSLLDHEADEALEALADLYLATGARDHFAMASRRLGSRAWRPIEDMAKAQLAAGDRAGAVAVFKAADQPGWHREQLRKSCQNLTGVDLTDENAPPPS